MKKLRKQVIEARLPELPKSVLPGGWDAFGRPWALMDCPTEKMPQVPSVHENSRLTVAVLVCFPPEPFYFVNTLHMDGVIRVSNKVGHRMHGGLSGELNADKTLKEAHKTYGRLKLPGYRDSLPPGMSEGTTVECISRRTMGKTTKPSGPRWRCKTWSDHECTHR